MKVTLSNGEGVDFPERTKPSLQMRQIVVESWPPIALAIPRACSAHDRLNIKADSGKTLSGIPYEYRYSRLFTLQPSIHRSILGIQVEIEPYGLPDDQLALVKSYLRACCELNLSVCQRDTLVHARLYEYHKVDIDPGETMEYNINVFEPFTLPVETNVVYATLWTKMNIDKSAT